MHELREVIPIDAHGYEREIHIPTVDGRHVRVEAGTPIQDSDGLRYVVERVNTDSLTLRREVPKVRGKAARKALKRARHA